MAASVPVFLRFPAKSRIKAVRSLLEYEQTSFPSSFFVGRLQKTTTKGERTRSEGFIDGEARSTTMIDDAPIRYRTTIETPQQILDVHVSWDVFPRHVSDKTLRTMYRCPSSNRISLSTTAGRECQERSFSDRKPSGRNQSTGGRLKVGIDDTMRGDRVGCDVGKLVDRSRDGGGNR